MTGFAREFAVKRFYPALLADPKFASALAAATRAYGSVEHPRIAKLAEYAVTAEGETFAAVEFVPGVDLGKVLAELAVLGQIMPAGTALALIMQAARVLGFAHQRGVAHLGIAPTNLIINNRGDVTVTDLAIFGACLPPRPAEEPRLAGRIAYLAPEQVLGQPLSAATDVFALAALAIEMMSGRPAFSGASPAHVAQAITSSQPAETDIPRQVARVLQRALSRSPLERFPDANGFADALEGALRMVSVHGVREDIGGIVDGIVARIGVPIDPRAPQPKLSTVPFPRVNAPSPFARHTTPLPPTNDEQTAISDNHDQETMPFYRESIPDFATDESEATVINAAMPITTSAPIGVRKSRPLEDRTIDLGLDMDAGEEKTVIGNVAMPDEARRPSNPSVSPPRRASSQGSGPVRLTGAGAAASATTVRRTGSAPSIAPPSSGFNDADGATVFDGQATKVNTPQPMAAVSTAPTFSSSGSAITLPANPPRVGAPRGPMVDPSLLVGTIRAAPAALPPPAPRRWPLYVAMTIVTVGSVGVGGYVMRKQKKKEAEQHRQTKLELASVAPTPASKPAAVVAATTDGGAVVVDGSIVVLDAGVVANNDATISPLDAVVPTPMPMAAPATTLASKPAVPGAAQHVITVPAGAQIFLGGVAIGASPVTVPATGNHAHLVAALSGYELSIGELPATGDATLTLKHAAPTVGDGGIKVLCKAPLRYYITLDGAPTGQMCPSERINTKVGAHTLDVYDLATNTHRQMPVAVHDTRLSARVKLD